MSNHPDPKQDQSKQMGGAHQQGAYPLDQYTVAPKQQGGEGDKSPYYKSAAPTISLPKGGGALKGIDEKFTVNAVNGTASLQIPFPLTPGRGGFTPNLSADYNSGSGNSEFGLGWGLSLPSIQRRTNKKLPLYNDSAESDVFLLAGAEDLVPKLDQDTSGNWVKDEDINVTVDGDIFTIKRYRPRIEGLFAKIEHVNKVGVGGSWWKVTTRDNIVTYYGLTSSARIADPEDPNRIFKWLPEVSFDNKGNVQFYEYIQEDLTGVQLSPHESNRLNGFSPFTNTYLKSVKYCNRTPYYPVSGSTPIPTYDISGVMPDPGDFLMQAVLDYGDHDPDAPTPSPSTSMPVRADAFSDFHAGFEIRTYRRCTRVLMFHYFDELDGGNAVLVRSVDLTYLLGATPSALSEVDYITTFTQSGYVINPGGGYFKKSLPPVTLTHTPLSWDNTIHNVSREDAENAPSGLTGGYEWHDLWGTGLPGILSEQAHGWFYKENLGEGHFTPALQISPKPSFQGMGHELHWQDLEADGRRQLVSTAPEMPGYYELNDDQEWENFRTFKEWINVDWHSPFTKTLDLNGDGRPDLLVTEDRVWRWYENEGEEGYRIGGEVSFDYDEEKKPRLLLNDMVQSIFLADMNGDGLTDIVRIENGAVCYWPNMGYGQFGAKVIMSNAPVFDRPDQFNPIYITLADISGTGAPDLIYIGKNRCTAWVNLSGNGWGDAYTKLVLPEISPETKIGVMDFLGNGTACIVWSSPLPQHAYAPLRYIDLMGGNKPYLMDTYSNGMGKVVSVQYKQSTKYYLEDKMGGKPWATNLPFPVHCIEKITTTDLVSQTSYTQLYSYHHGYYDHAEREFRGFGRVETIDTDSAKSFMPDGFTPHNLDQYPVLTKTWYHTGAWMRERTLLAAFSEEYYPTGWAELPIVPDLPAGLTPQEQREAYRALKSQPLRQEVYALDRAVSGSLADVPYAVATHSYAVLKVQAVEDNLYGSFLSYQQQSLEWSAERYVADPRVVHKLTLSVDELGNVLESAAISYPRDAVGIATITALIPSDTTDPAYLPFTNLVAEQSKMLISYTVNTFTHDATDGYHLRVPCEVKTYEVTGLTPAAVLWTVADMNAALPTAGANEISYTVPFSGGPQMRKISHMRVLYMANDAETVKNFGDIESLGIPHRKFQLAITPDMLSDVSWYGTLTINSSTALNTVLGTEGGYIDEATITEFPLPHTTDNWWLPGGTVNYYSGPGTPILMPFYSPHKVIDPWGNETEITYWDDAGTNYYMLPQSTTDAKGNVTAVTDYNWYNLQPAAITDMNDNISEILYDALGMPVAMAMKGKVTSTTVEADELLTLTGSGIDPNDPAGADIASQALFWGAPETYAADLLGRATWRCVYDLETFATSNMPVAVAMIAREVHYPDEVVGGVRTQSPLLIRLSYTDGLGRQAMYKAQAALDPDDTDHPTERWIGSGKTVYNNKGNPVMQYEPYFSGTPAFDYEEDAILVGVSPRIHYDALGRVIRTDLPDGSFTKVEFDAWRELHFDNNDTVAASDWFFQRDDPSGAYHGIAEEVDAKDKANTHNDTPTISYLDTLGRVFLTEDVNGVFDSAGALLSNVSYYSYCYQDIAGDRLEIHDARGLIPITYTYNMLKAVVRQVSIDSGTQYILLDVAGQPLYGWDAAYNQFKHYYDELRRPIQKDTYNPLGVSGTQVIEYIEYVDNDSGSFVDNLNGRPYRHYDGAGVVVMDSYNFKGESLSVTRKFTADPTVHPDWGTVVSTGSPATGFMESTLYTTLTEYDAIGRPTKITAPGLHGGITYYEYEKTGLLYAARVDDVHGLTMYGVINFIRYNAQGQRIKIKFENNAVTKYTYDPKTFRVTNIKTTRPTAGSSGSFDILQDLNYWYDPVGNITLQDDATGEDIFYDNTIARPVNDYTYDCLYRLIIAKGKELIGTNAAMNNDDSDKKKGMPVITDVSAMQPYTQYYAYDEVGNMLEINHSASTGWTRYYNYGSTPVNNQLVKTRVGTSGSWETYSYDARGNINGGMAHLNGGGASMVYNAENRLESVIVTGSITSYYQYDAGGQRVRKTVLDRASNFAKIRKYVGLWEEYKEDSVTISSGGSTTIITSVTTTSSGGSYPLIRETLHVMDDCKRVVMIDTEITPGTTQTIRYQFSNHLDTASLELDDNADIITYEEYYPFGSTSFQSGRSITEVSLKRYKFTSKERDEETGLYYHGARYYCPWLARWCATDPINGEWYNITHGAQDRDTKRQFVELTVSNYEYCCSNPIKFVDFTGEFAFWDNLGGAIIGAIVDIIFQVVTSLLNKETLEDALSHIDWKSVGISFLSGFLSDGLSAMKKLANMPGLRFSAKALLGALTDYSKQIEKKMTGDKDHPPMSFWDAVKDSDLLKSIVSGVVGAGIDEGLPNPGEKQLEENVGKAKAALKKTPRSTTKQARLKAAEKQLTRRKLINKSGKSILGNSADVAYDKIKEKAEERKAERKKAKHSRPPQKSSSPPPQKDKQPSLPA